MVTVHFPLVSICVCTYKRMELFAKLLSSLALQEANGRFTYEVVVVDNDKAGSARGVVEQARHLHPELAISYQIEPTQGISFARNLTVALAKGSFLAFIDDDEQASAHWLAELYDTLVASQADAVFGPVLPDYPSGTPKWLIKSRLFERPRHVSGTRLTSHEGRTSNALVRAEWASRRQPQPFDIRFAHTGGEDHDFFKWMEAKGGRLYWCDSAEVMEFVPRSRQSLGFILKRRFRASVTYWRGVNSQRPYRSALAEALAGMAGGILFALLGLLAVPLGLHRSVRYWVKSVNGFGRLGAMTTVRLVGYGNVHD